MAKNVQRRLHMVDEKRIAELSERIGTVKGWIAKGEGVYATAARELPSTESPNYDAACFHAQQ
jgi:HEPN domain-containing protein